MIGIFLLTHSSYGEALIQCACHVLNKRPVQIVQLGVAAQDDPLDAFLRSNSVIPLSPVAAFPLGRQQRLHQRRYRMRMQ